MVDPVYRQFLNVFNAFKMEEKPEVEKKTDQPKESEEKVKHEKKEKEEKKKSKPDPSNDEDDETTVRILQLYKCEFFVALYKYPLFIGKLDLRNASTFN